MKEKQKSMDSLIKWKIPNKINIYDFTLLKKIICKSFLTNPNWFEHQNGYEVFSTMDNTIIGVS